MMSKDSDEALYEFAHWLSEKGREAREELVYKQYTPWIDDVALGRLEDNAYDDVVKRIYKEALDNLEFPRTYGNRINWDSFVSDLVSRLLEEHKMEIVDAAAEKLAKSIRNSKAFKERKQEVMEDTE